MSGSASSVHPFCPLSLSLVSPGPPATFLSTITHGRGRYHSLTTSSTDRNGCQCPPPPPPEFPNPSTGCTPRSSKCWFWLCLFICPTHSEVTRGVVFDTASQISPTLHTNINIWPQLLKISPLKKKKVEKYQPCVAEE